MPSIDPTLWFLAVAVTLFGGVIKGAVGFALPMIMISGLSTFLAPELALAALILPTVGANVLQATRAGFRSALTAVQAHKVYLAIVLVMIALSAQIVRFLPDTVMFLMIGVPVTLFSLAQLLGWRFRVPDEHRRRVEIAVGTFAGFLGGISGTWGPPTVAYLTALETPKVQSVQIQGLIYGSGAVVLLAAHIGSGLFAGERAMLSAILCIPAALGMLIGFYLQDRMDQQRFRTITLIVLVVAGANLIRRGVVGA